MAKVKIFSLIGIFFILFGNIEVFSTAQEIYEAHRVYFESQLAKVTDEELQQNPQISGYAGRFVEDRDEVYRKFAEYRIDYKQVHQVYPGMTKTHAFALKNNEEFMQTFVTFMKCWDRAAFLDQLNRRVMAIAPRGARTPDYPHGKPEIDPIIRAANVAYLEKIDTLREKLSAKVDTIMADYVRTHQ